jgi:zinc transport system substrate-binding protein
MLWVSFSSGIISLSPDASSTGAQNNSENNRPHMPQVIASFFPLYDFAKHVGGSKINATTMVPVGVEPHDWEPTSRQILGLRSADLFIYNGAGIDTWANKVETKTKVNLAEGLPLITDSHGNHDPHTWLDPILAERQVEIIRNGLIRADPQNTDYYIQNAQSYISKLQDLDEKIKTELSDCRKTDFIAFHSAFSYFSNRYNLRQHTILGTDPEGDILPQTLSELIQFAKQYGIHVIYSEELLDPRNAQTIANEIPNGKVLVLSPIEGVDADEQKAGIGYIEKMEMNLKNLKEGLECN